jgi:hypothetical protein
MSSFNKLIELEYSSIFDWIFYISPLILAILDGTSFNSARVCSIKLTLALIEVIVSSVAIPALILSTFSFNSSNSA